VLQNRAFQKVTPGTPEALNAWTSVGGATLEVVADVNPLSSALPNVLEATIPAGSVAGFSNAGYFGINVNQDWTYNASFFFRFPSDVPSSPVVASVSLLGATSGNTFITGTVTLIPTAEWTQVTVELTPRSTAPDTDNVFTVTIDGSSFSGIVHFALFSLFPPTWKGQKNGMRVDIADALAELKPSFFRFPGGNNLEVRLAMLLSPSCANIFVSGRNDFNEMAVERNGWATHRSPGTRW